MLNHRLLWTWLGVLSVPLLGVSAPARQQQQQQEAVSPPPSADAPAGVGVDEPAATQPAEASAPAPSAAMGLKEAASVLEVLGPPAGSDQPKRLREGSYVVRRRGHVVREPSRGVLVFVFEPCEPGRSLPPMVLQAGRGLETMGNFLRRRGNQAGGEEPPATFTVSGPVHAYHGVNYLLPTLTSGPTRSDRSPDSGATSGAEDEKSDAASARSQSSPPSRAGDSSASKPGARTPASAKDVMKQLQGERQAAPMPAPRPEESSPRASRSGEAQTTGASRGRKGSGPGSAPLKREGSLVLHRRARLVHSPEQGRMLLVFEADSPAATDPPMVVQACQLLERMEKQLSRSDEPLVLMASGEVHTYRGRNYLMPTMMKVLPDRENLRN